MSDEEIKRAVRILSKALRSRRAKDKLAIREVEEATGVSASTISRIENLKGKPDAETVGDLAKTGYYKDDPKKTKIHGNISAMTLEKILRCDDEKEKKALWKIFREALGFLGKKWKKYQNKSIEVAGGSDE